MDDYSYSDSSPDVDADTSSDFSADSSSDFAGDTSSDFDTNTSSDFDGDLSEDIPDDIPEDVGDDFDGDLSEEDSDIPEDISDDFDDDLSEESSDIPDDIPEDLAEDADGDLSEEGSDIPDDIPEDVSDDVDGDLSEESYDIPDDIPEDVSEDMDGDLSEDGSDISDDIPEYVSDDVDGDLSKEGSDIPDDIPEDMGEDVDGDLSEEGVGILEGTENDSNNDGNMDINGSELPAETGDLGAETSGTSNGPANLDTVVDHIVDSDLSPEHKKELLEQVKSDLKAAGSSSGPAGQPEDMPGSLQQPDTDDTDGGTPVRVLKRGGSDTSISHRDYEQELADLDSGIENSRRLYDDIAADLDKASENIANDSSLSPSEKLSRLRENKDKLQSLKAQWDGESAELYQQRADLQEKLYGGTAPNMTGIEQPEVTDNVAADEHHWDRTMLTTEEEAVLNEIDLQEGTVVEKNEGFDPEPVHSDLVFPSDTGTFRGDRGNSPFVPSDSDALAEIEKYGADSVEYRDGYPDFTPFSKHDSPWGEFDTSVEIPHMTADRQNPKYEFGRRSSSHAFDEDIGNFSQADNELASRYGLDPMDIQRWREDNGLTWHEYADGKTMQLVPTKIHSACRHSGGVSEMKYRQEWGDITKRFPGETD